MIVSKTPLRVSFFGGGSDIPAFYENNEGLVVSTAINSYIYIALNKCVANHIKIVYSEMEQHDTDHWLFSMDNIGHDRVREALKIFEIKSNVEIVSFSDVTVKGTGLGSSSTFTVGLVNALHKAINHKNIEKHDLAELASYIEINRCNEPIGKQDQYAAAYGGFNAIHFKGTNIWVKPLAIHQETVYDLQHNLFLFNTGVARKASDILGTQTQKLRLLDENTVSLTKSLVTLAQSSMKLLERRKIDDFGQLLDHAWLVKRTISPDGCPPVVDEMYERALQGGALGGKLLGAGGGGYLLVYCPIKERNRMLETMKNYERLPFKFSKEGSTIEMVS